MRRLLAPITLLLALSACSDPPAQQVNKRMATASCAELRDIDGLMDELTPLLEQMTNDELDKVAGQWAGATMQLDCFELIDGLGE